jgi:hypothetical protein
LVPAFVLEHLLEHQFDVYFPKVRDAIEAGDRRMAEMLDLCYAMGQAEAHAGDIVALLRQHGIESRYHYETDTDGTAG